MRSLLDGRDLVSELRLAIKMTLAGTLAWFAASELGAHKPIFAVLVPLVAMSGDPFNALSVLVDRILGVFAGVGLGIAIVHLSVPGTVMVALALGGGTLAGLVLRTGQRVNVQAAVSAMFMIAVSGSSQVGVARVWETAVGAVITIAVSSLIWPPNPARELRLRLGRLRQELAADLSAIADDLATGSGASARQLDEVRAHSLDAIRDVFELEPAKRALRLNPLRRGDAAEIAELERETQLAARLYRHTRSIARDVADADTQSEELAEATRQLAHATDLALAGESPKQPLERAEHALDKSTDVVISTQLRQLLVDLRSGLSTQP